MAKQHPSIKSVKFAPAPIVETFWFEHRSMGLVLVKALPVAIHGRPDLGRIEIVDGENEGCSFVAPKSEIAAARTAS